MARGPFAVLDADPDARLRPLSPARTDRHPKGYGPHECDAHDECRTITRQRGTRSVELASLVQLEHPDVFWAAEFGPTIGVYDGDSHEFWSQLGAAQIDRTDLTVVTTPGDGHAHVYGKLRAGNSHPFEVFGSTLRYGDDQYVVLPGQRRGDQGAYVQASGSLSSIDYFPEFLLDTPGDQVEYLDQRASKIGYDYGYQDHSASLLDPFSQVSNRPSSHPLETPVGVPNTCVNQDRFEGPVEDVEKAQIGHWDVELDWCFVDWAGSLLTPQQRIVRAVVIQEAQRHRKAIVDLGCREIGAKLGISYSMTARYLRELRALGAIVKATDHYWHSNRQVKTLVTGYRVPGLLWDVSDRPRNTKPKNRYPGKGVSK